MASGALVQFIQELVQNNYDDMAIINETRLRFGVKVSERTLNEIRDMDTDENNYDIY